MTAPRLRPLLFAEGARLSLRRRGRVQKLGRLEVRPQARRDLARRIMDVPLDLLWLDRAQHDGDDSRMAKRELDRRLAQGDLVLFADLLDRLHLVDDRLRGGRIVEFGAGS